ncbi:MAG: HAMP domain-containing protein, partial [Proteobacteria bacterium]|nr:HAMP domain-containing protein [Pseudomonadota bacterium]
MSRLHAGSLDRRLARWLALLALAGLTLTCLGVYTVTALSFEDRQADTLRQKQLQVRHLIAEAGVVGNAALTHKLDDAMVGRQDLTLVLTDAKGQVLYAGPTAPPLRQTLVTRFEAATASGPVQATLTLDTTEDDRVLSRLARTLAAAALTGSIIIAIGGFTLVQLGLRPVRNLALQVQALAADTLDRRLDGSAQPEELAALVQHVNDLLDRLHRAYEQLEAFNADVAHELFTPLATLIGGTEVALRKAREADELRDVLGEHLEELQRMSLIVQDMLFLSQADR